MAQSFEDLRVWQNAMNFVSSIYRASKTFPREEMYGLTSQLRRAAMSIPNNIAEGKGYRTDKDFVRFLYMSRGSCHEVQCTLMIARDLGYLELTEFKKLRQQVDYIGRELNNLIHALEKPKAKSATV